MLHRRYRLPFLPVSQNIVVKNGAAPGNLHWFTYVPRRQARCKRPGDPVPFRFAFRMKYDSLGPHIRPAAAELAVNVAKGESFFKLAEKGKQFIHILYNRRYFPAIEGIAEVYFLFSVLQLLIQIPDTGKA